MQSSMRCFFFFFFNDTATTEIYTLSLHDALPIYRDPPRPRSRDRGPATNRSSTRSWTDRKSTRLNSSHGYISYAVFCLKKKKKKRRHNFEIVDFATHHQRMTTTRTTTARCHDRHI